MDAIFIPAAQLGGTVFTVVAFLWYLTKLLKVQTDRDEVQARAIEKQADSNVKLAVAFQLLSSIITKNTIAVKANKPAVEDNTGAVDENTAVIKVKNGKNKH